MIRSAHVGNAWLRLYSPKPTATMRLICFSYAGGSARYFRQWENHLPDEMDVVPVELPGRGTRLNEVPIDNMRQLIDEAMEGLEPLITSQPFAFFGHSMGGTIAFELARRIRREFAQEPRLLGVSACRSPHRMRTVKSIHKMAAPALINELRTLNGTPAEVLANGELMDLLLPAIRADFAILENYRHVIGDRFHCPILGLHGANDQYVTGIEMRGWRQHTTGPFNLKRIQGDHFFLHFAAQQVAQLLGKNITLDERIDVATCEEVASRR